MAGHGRGRGQWARPGGAAHRAGSPPPPGPGPAGARAPARGPSGARAAANRGANEHALAQQCAALEHAVRRVHRVLVAAGSPGAAEVPGTVGLSRLQQYGWRLDAPARQAPAGLAGREATAGLAGPAGREATPGSAAAAGREATPGSAAAAGREATAGLAGPAGREATAGLAGLTGTQVAVGLAGPAGRGAAAGSAGPAGRQVAASSVAPAGPAGKTAVYLLCSGDLMLAGGRELRPAAEFARAAFPTRSLIPALGSSGQQWVEADRLDDDPAEFGSWAGEIARRWTAALDGLLAAHGCAARPV